MRTANEDRRGLRLRFDERPDRGLVVSQSGRRCSDRLACRHRRRLDFGRRPTRREERHELRVGGRVIVVQSLPIIDRQLVSIARLGRTAGSRRREPMSARRERRYPLATSARAKMTSSTFGVHVDAETRTLWVCSNDASGVGVPVGSSRSAARRAAIGPRETWTAGGAGLNEGSGLRKLPGPIIKLTK